MNTIKNEPVMTAWVPAVVTAVLGLLVAFGVPVTAEQQQAILVFTPIAASAVGAVANWMARNRVTPVHKLK